MRSSVIVPTERAGTERRPNADRGASLAARPAALRYSTALVSIWTVLVLTLEVLSAQLFTHRSVTYARVSRQYGQAVSVRPSRPGEPDAVLMLGNSLLLEGLDENRLEELTAGRMRLYPVFLEATGYYDWLYGLRRLFRAGARPQVVVLGVGVNSFFSNSIRQEYAPLVFFDTQDVFDVAADLKLGHTELSDLLLAHWSVFWDIRGVIRTQILRHVVPHYRELVLLLKPQPAIPPLLEFEEVAHARLSRLRALCEAYGTKLVILVPPAPASEDAVRQMTIASQGAGVEALIPLDPRRLSKQYYQPDEIHLNADGAALFTSALASSLRHMVDREPRVASD